MLVIQRKATKKWAFSNVMSVTKYHLMTYIDLFKFLAKPDAEWSVLSNINQTELQFET